MVAMTKIVGILVFVKTIAVGKYANWISHRKAVYFIPNVTGLLTVREIIGRQLYKVFSVKSLNFAI